MECIKGFYKKRVGRVTEATHKKVKLVFHEGDAPLTWMEVNKLERIPEPEPEPEVDPDSLVVGPRDEKQVLDYVKGADDGVLELLDMFEPIEGGDPLFVESIRYRATQALALTRQDTAAVVSEHTNKAPVVPEPLIFWDEVEQSPRADPVNPSSPDDLVAHRSMGRSSLSGSR